MWIEIINQANNGYYIKYSVHRNLYNFFLTNFVLLWEISIEERELENLLLENNPLLGDNESSLVKSCTELIFNGLSKNNIRSNFKLNGDTSESQIELELIVSNDNFTIKLPLLFFSSNSNVFCKEVTMPMVMKLNELQKSEDVLIDLLNKKDKEISEYKAEGAVLPLKHLETKKFCINKHKIDWKLLDDNLKSINMSSVITSLHQNLGIPEDFNRISCKIEKSSPNISKPIPINGRVDSTLQPKSVTKVKVEIKAEPGQSNIEESKQNTLDVKKITSIQMKKRSANKRKLNF